VQSPDSIVLVTELCVIVWACPVLERSICKLQVNLIYCISNNVLQRLDCCVFMRWVMEYVQLPPLFIGLIVSKPLHTLGAGVQVTHFPCMRHTAAPPTELAG
jgi:hypothetical protein